MRGGTFARFTIAGLSSSTCRFSLHLKYSTRALVRRFLTLQLVLQLLDRAGRLVVQRRSQRRVLCAVHVFLIKFWGLLNQGPSLLLVKHFRGDRGSHRALRVLDPLLCGHGVHGVARPPQRRGRRRRRGQCHVCAVHADLVEPLTGTPHLSQGPPTWELF